MTDDIVTRLRGYDFMRDGDIPDMIMSEAADEIQRLRKLISELAEIMMPYALLMTKAEQEQVLKAVRGGL